MDTTVRNVLSVDVGTGSIRVALITFIGSQGRVLGEASCPITTYASHNNIRFEQDSREIWSNFLSCGQQVLTQANVTTIDAIAFDATASVVVIPKVGSTFSFGELDRDVILWMDHRATDQAEQIGMDASPEFSISKILWWKQVRGDTFDQVNFLDLPDFMTYQCIEDKDITSFQPSNCSVTCKWFYDPVNKSWPLDLLKRVDLNEVTQLPHPVLPGSFVGFMSKSVKESLGLDPSIEVKVATSIIDAHAGALGMVALDPGCDLKSDQVTSDIDLVCSVAGTSTCHLTFQTETPVKIDGIWGPYYSVVTDGDYVYEPGQTATGKMVASLIKLLPDMKDLSVEAASKQLDDLLRSPSSRRTSIIMNPNFHGNRSPYSLPDLTGGVYGLDTNPSSHHLYLSLIESLVYESVDIFTTLSPSRSPSPSRVLVSGGLTNNLTFMQTYADVLQRPVVAMDCGRTGTMLVGTSIMALQCAIGSDLKRKNISTIRFSDFTPVTYMPSQDNVHYHLIKYEAFKRVMKTSIEVHELMKSIPF